MMARASKQVLQAAVMGFGIPAILLILTIMLFIPKEQPDDVPETTCSQIPGTSSVVEQPGSYSILVLNNGETLEMDLEEYVVGVVLAEMPASFDLEALKAQAVASRTYALKTCMDGDKHAGAVCTSYQCCQSYMSAEDYLQRGWSVKSVERVRQAVVETAGEVLIYDGALIRATYFACSGGCTEDALAVWGREYPYLKSVKSPGEEETVYFTYTQEFSVADFQDALGVMLTGTPDTWFGYIDYTQGGGVNTVQIGGVTYRGTTLRALLSLRSTVFEVIVSDEKIIFVTNGYGHRVGMSQYGADAMAIDGHDYHEILAYYYQCTQLVNYSQIHP